MCDCEQDCHQFAIQFGERTPWRCGRMLADLHLWEMPPFNIFFHRFCLRLMVHELIPNGFSSFYSLSIFILSSPLQDPGSPNQLTTVVIALFSLQKKQNIPPWFQQCSLLTGNDRDDSWPLIWSFLHDLMHDCVSVAQFFNSIVHIGICGV